ncbi:hypothetical protein QWY87_13615 [Lutimonas halocynthiae]|uniref:hypothetical protein n=1 Tax=Lutimonas halocynthiae TaxID=1446477 RepID=UPI0025B31518|nr:hypothetical protein [Lutimonas halocynthiae]MDN3643749.1 hypothetical protein [Lutimonas halocynthiae]
MKKITTLLIILMFSFPAILLSQEEEETISPSYKTEIIRNVSVLDIEGIVYKNVTVSLKSNNQGRYVGETSKVKVKIVNVDGRLIWNKTLKNAYLYVFSNGDIQVGRPRFNKIIIDKVYSGDYVGEIREYEGIY